MIALNNFLVTSIFVLCGALAGMAGSKPHKLSAHEVIIRTKEGTICTCTYDGVKRLSLKNDRLYYGIYLNEIFCKQGILQGKPLHGKFNRYDVRNNIVESGLFRYGLKEGLWKHLSENGYLTEITQYRKGVQCGKRTILLNGVPVIREKYRNGKLTGNPKSLNTQKILSNEKESRVEKIKMFKKHFYHRKSKEKIQPDNIETPKSVED